MDSPSSKEILQAIKEKGYWISSHSATGTRVDGISQNGFDLQTVEALDMCKVAAFDNQQARNVISDSIKQPVLGFYRAFGQTKRYHCFLNNTPESTSEMSIIALWLCSSNTILSLLDSSHHHEMNATQAQNGLLAIPEGRPDELGIRPELVELASGGYALADGRLGWKVLRGKVVFAGVMVPEEATHWYPMPLPNTKACKDKVDEMERESRTFCKNFTWGEPSP